MSEPRIDPRDMIAVQQLIDSAESEDYQRNLRLTSPQLKAYNTLLYSARHLAEERNRFDDEAVHERRRRLRAERALRYAHKWCGGLMAIVVILGFAVVVLVNIR